MIAVAGGIILAVIFFVVVGAIISGINDRPYTPREYRPRPRKPLGEYKPGTLTGYYMDDKGRLQQPDQLAFIIGRRLRPWFRKDRP